MRAAQHHQVIRIIVAPLRAQIQVMQIDEGGIPAPRNYTTSPIAAEYFPTNRRRRALRRAPVLQSSWRNICFTTHVDVRLRELAGIDHLGVGVRGLSGSTSHPGFGEFVGDARASVGAESVAGTRPSRGLCEVAGIGCGTVSRIGGESVHVRDWDSLRVAATHLDDCRIELDQAAVRMLKATPAVFTLSHDHLVTGAAGIARAAQDFTRHQQQSGVIIESMVAPLPKLLDRFAKGRQRFCTNFEAQNVPDELWPAPIRGPVTRREPRNHALNLTRRLPARRQNPFVLGFRTRDAAQLPHH
jgi:hypothetical protein